MNTGKPYCFSVILTVLISLYSIIPAPATELSKEEQAYLHKKGTVVFISQTRYPPFEFVDKNGEHTGMCIELARWMATELGFTARFVDSSFQEAQRAVLSGKADVLTSLFYSKKRDKLFDFTQVMFEVPASIFVVAERTDIKDLCDLNGKLIAMQSGDYAKEFLESKDLSFGLVYTKDFADATDLVIAGKADALIGDEQIVLYHIFKNRLTKKIKKVGEPLYIGQNCMATRESNQVLVNILKKGINLAKKNGIFEKINRKWIGTRYALKESLLFKYFPHILVSIGVVFMLLMLVWFWNIRLRHEVKKRTRELEKSEEKYRTVLESNPDPVVVYDMKGRVIYLNPAFTRVFGWSLEELAGKKIDNFVPEKNWPETRMMIEKVTVSGESFSGVETRRYTKEGTVLDVSISGACYRDQDGKVIASVINLRDISEQKRLEEQLQKARKMEAMGIMAGGVAHDLNNILSGIVSYPELILLDLPEDSPLRRPIKTIQESGKRAADVVEDLMTIARGAASAKEVLNLNALVKEYLISAEYQKLEKRYSFVDFNTESDPDLLNIKGSPIHVKKTLMNLVTNAAEAVEGRGTVTISTRNQYLDQPLRGYEDVHMGEYVVVTVSDDGPGISPEDLERIFEPFYSKKVMGRSGTGLGLSVVWNTVQDHSGYIDIRTSGKGSAFELYFPVSREKLPAEGEEPSMEHYEGHEEKILVVDDEESQREIACGILTKLGYTAVAASSGEEAVEYMKQHTMDLIVLDMVMPKGINGRETYERILDLHPGQRAIIASGYAKTKEVELALELGAGKYIKKPYTLAKIGIAVKEELARPIGRIRK